MLIIYGILFLLAGYFLPKEIDWSPSFSMEHVRPYGCRVLFEELPFLFEDEKMMVNTESFYESQPDLGSWNGNLIMIDEYLDLDSLELNVLLDYVSEGNSALLSANDFPDLLLDTFGLRVESEFKINEVIKGGYRGTEIVHNFYSSELKSDTGYVMLVDASAYYFMATDSLDKCVGLAWMENEEQVNLVRKTIGKGQVFLHSNPFVFSNFNLLSSEGSRYVARVLTHLPKGGIVWDEYHKKVNLSKRESILNVLLSDPALKKAVYLSLMGVFLILLFMSKRKQRIIKPIEVFSNDSKELVSTIGNMYYNTSNNTEILAKKIQLFKQDMYRIHGLRDLRSSETTIKMLVERTGITQEEMKNYLSQLEDVENLSVISDHQLKKINDIINRITYGRKYGIESTT